MRFGVLGINYKSADLDLREALTRGLESLYRANSLASYRYKTVLLSTCNRSELYFYSSDLSEQHSKFLQELRREIHREFEHALYSFFGEECLSHLSKVTAGFDSAFLGEGEIQRQVKHAYLGAKNQMELPQDLHYLFQKSLHNGKVLRTDLRLEEGVPSLPSVIAQKTAELCPQKVLIVGHSEIGNKCIKALKRRGVENLFIATRYPEQVYLPVVPVERWNEFDVVIATSKTSQPIISGQSGVTQLIFDVSMPRCTCSNLTVPVVNIDALGRLVETVRLSKVQLVLDGEKKISQIVARQFMLANQRRARQVC
ncbi:MAG: hypothetical protein H7A39_02120 [Chlamydiales bacterium]|nr:hypothetical protein [Chlamydiales bacterium]